MSITVVCTNCQKRFRTPPTFSGKRVRCPACTTVNLLPTVMNEVSHQSVPVPDLSDLKSPETLIAAPPLVTSAVRSSAVTDTDRDKHTRRQNRLILLSASSVGGLMILVLATVIISVTIARAARKPLKGESAQDAWPSGVKVPDDFEVVSRETIEGVQMWRLKGNENSGVVDTILIARVLRPDDTNGLEVADTHAFVNDALKAAMQRECAVPPGTMIMIQSESYGTNLSMTARFPVNYGYISSTRNVEVEVLLFDANGPCSVCVVGAGGRITGLHRLGKSFVEAF